MTVHFRTVALSKDNDSEQRAQRQTPRSPATYLIAVVFAVASGLCAVAWIFG
jgi:hypothetical protein